MVLRNAFLMLLTFATVLSFSSCAGNSVIAPTTLEPTKKIKARMMVPHSKNFDADATLDLLGRSQPEPGVDAVVWGQLKDELAGALEARRDSKYTSERPTGAQNAIVDLAVVDDGAGGQQIEWSYVNNGDYDQNGEVGLSDITPIVLNYSQNSAGQDWDNAKLADGDGNEEVNIADVTPIALHYGVNCSGYNIYGRNGGSGPYTLVDTVSFASSSLTPVRSFVWPVAEPSYTNYMVAAYDFMGDDTPGSTIANENVSVIDDQGLVIAQRTDTTVTLTGDASNVEIGQILVSGEGEGFMGIVDSIDTSGGDTVVTYTQAALDDVFDYVHIDYQTELNFDDIQDAEYFVEGLSIEKAVSQDGADHQTSEFGDIIFKFKEHEFPKSDGDPTDTFFGMTLQGEVKLNIDIVAKIHIGKSWTDFGHLYSFEFGSTLKVTGAVTAKFVLKKKWIGQARLLARLPGPPIPVPVGLPIVIVPMIDLYANLIGEVEGAMTIMPSVEMSATAGLRYSDETGFDPYFSNTDPVGDMGWEKMETYVQAQLDLNLFSPEPSLKIMGVAGPFMKFHLPFFRGQVKLVLSGPEGNQIVATGYAGARAWIGAKFELFGKTLAEYQTTGEPVFDILVEIAEYKWPFNQPIPPLEPATITINWQAESDAGHAEVLAENPSMNRSRQYIPKPYMTISQMDEDGFGSESWSIYNRSDPEDILIHPYAYRIAENYVKDGDNNPVSGTIIYEIGEFIDRGTYIVGVEYIYSDWPIIITDISVHGGLLGYQEYGPQYAFYGEHAVFMTFSNHSLSDNYRELFFSDPVSGKNTYPIYPSGSRLDADGWFPHRD